MPDPELTPNKVRIARNWFLLAVGIASLCIIPPMFSEHDETGAGTAPLILLSPLIAFAVGKAIGILTGRMAESIAGIGLLTFFIDCYLVVVFFRNASF